MKQNFKIIIDALNHPNLKSLLTMLNCVDLFARIVKSMTFYLIVHLICLITLLVSTTTTEIPYSAIKIIKTKLQNKMEDKFLSDYLHKKKKQQKILVIITIILNYVFIFIILISVIKYKIFKCIILTKKIVGHVSLKDII